MPLPLRNEGNFALLGVSPPVAFLPLGLLLDDPQLLLRVINMFRDVSMSGNPLDLWMGCELLFQGFTVVQRRFFSGAELKSNHRLTS